MTNAEPSEHVHPWMDLDGDPTLEDDIRRVLHRMIDALMKDDPEAAQRFKDDAEAIFGKLEDGDYERE